MRWSTKRTPQTGDTRTVTKFAWTPTRISDTLDRELVTTVWFERYLSCQCYYGSGHWHETSRLLIK